MSGQITLQRAHINTLAPDFALQDFEGGTVRLSEDQVHKGVDLIFSYGQEVKLFKLGRMPAQDIVDK